MDLGLKAQRWKPLLKVLWLRMQFFQCHPGIVGQQVTLIGSIVSIGLEKIENVDLII